MQIAADELIRRFSIRAPSWMWLIGAGASAGSGVATAENMIWDFKRFLYRTAEGIPPQALADLSNPAVRNQIQAFFDAEGSHPQLGAEEEYAHYFELAYPHELDRRTYIEAKTVISWTLEPLADGTLCARWPDPQFTVVLSVMGPRQCSKV